MRLIDADKYCDFLNTYPLEKAQNNFMSFYRKALQNTFEFEVKAIPVKWLRQWFAENRFKFYDDNDNIYLVCDIEEMLLDWEKENETN